MKRIFLAITLLFLFLGLVFFIFVKINSLPVSSDKNLLVFVVGKGDGLNSIGAKLENKKLIRNKYIFIFQSYLLGLNKKIQSGSFRLSPSMTVKEIASKLSKGGTVDYWLQIKGGNRVEEIASLFPKDISFTYDNFLSKAKKYEGKLFPDSYLIPQYYNIDQILDLVEKNFTEKLNEAKKNSTNNLSDKEILILASLLEREGRTLESKQKIAGILMNRLEIGMPLQIDATVQYIRDDFSILLSSSHPPVLDYWKPITKKDISNLISPYNTYKNKGLPPAPICNPGYNSLYAAYHPIASDNLFYLTDDDGVMHYAKTLDEHNKNIQKYLK